MQLEMNQRQKKKGSQGKKRYHEAARKNEAHTKASTQPQKPVESKPVKTAVVDESFSHKKNESDQSGKNYSKRKIASNWSRYEEGDDGNEHLRSSETEEELQQRLVQLFNLPTQVHVPFTFTEPDHFMADPKESTNYITLDCNKLAESLAIIPLHDRLDLNVELLEMGGYSATCSSYEQKVTKDKHSENEPRKIYLPHQIKAMDKLTPYKKQSVLKSELSEKQKPTVPVAPSHAQALPTPTAEQSIAVPTTSDHTVERNAGSDDSELDSLELRANVNGGVSEMAMLTGTQETDELDDILDELLA